MYQGLGIVTSPYVMGSSGHIIDCTDLSNNFFQGACWNPFAKSYSMLDYTTQSDLGPAASPATVAAVAASTEATIQQQCADYPADCAIASSTDPYGAAAVAGVQQGIQNLAGAIPTWLWAVLIGGGALLVFAAVKR